MRVRKNNPISRELARDEHGDERPGAKHQVARSEIFSANVQRDQFRNGRGPRHAAHGVAEIGNEHNSGEERMF
jgi:hypothetical protein